MPDIDPLYAQWLTSDGKYHVAAYAALVARWGDTAAASSRMTCLATKAAASAEAARQLAFMGGPLAEDEHLLEGAWAQFRGQVITLTAPVLGYQAGRDVFVLAVSDEGPSGLSRVTVLTRLT